MPVTSPSLMVKYPLHHIISDTTSTEQGTTRFIRAMFTADPECIRRPDELGMTPLTVAILRENAAAITALLELASPLMAQGQDPLGLQVPDRQQENAVMQNARLLRASKRFLIHDLLEGASKDITQAYIHNRLPVCSCAKCTEGWLSPKMRFRLRETAHDIYMAMLPKLDLFDEGRSLDEAALKEDTPLSFIPEETTAQGVNKIFYVAYRSAFHAIRCFLSEPDTVPTIDKLRIYFVQGAKDGRYSLPGIEYFAKRGGSIKHAMDMVIHLSACLSRTSFGDGSFDNIWDEPLPTPSPQSTPAEGSPSPRLSRILSVIPTVDVSPRTSRNFSASAPVEPGNPANRRRRSSSFKDVLNQFGGKRDRRSWLLDIQEVEKNLEIERKRRLKEEWEDASAPGCPLDDQFVGVRYLVGLHSPPRWDVEDLDAGFKRVECKLRRM